MVLQETSSVPPPEEGGVSPSACPPIRQVHAQHHRRALGVGGGLPVRPRGDAAGRQGEPAALPRGLRAQRLGDLEPLQPGEPEQLQLQLRLICASSPPPVGAVFPSEAQRIESGSCAVSSRAAHASLSTGCWAFIFLSASTKAQDERGAGLGSR